MQRLSGSLIEFTCDCIEMLLAMHREVGTFWEVLAQKSVGVLVGAALPRAVRIAEVDIEISRSVSCIAERKAAVPCG